MDLKKNGMIHFALYFKSKVFIILNSGRHLKMCYVVLGLGPHLFVKVPRPVTTSLTTHR